MRFFIRKKSVWWPLLVIGLVLAGLWANMLLKNQQRTDGFANLEVEDFEHRLELPNFMAPVIGREIHKKQEEKDSEEAKTNLSVFSFKLPAVEQIFKLNP